MMGGGMKLKESLSDLAYYFLRPHLYVLGPGDKFDCPNGHASVSIARSILKSGSFRTTITAVA